jgi:hypothetical protein
VPADADAAHLIRARATCAIAAAGSPSTPAEVVPDYRREADAARVRASQASAGRA